LQGTRQASVDSPRGGKDIIREITARFRAIIRTALRWGGRLVALIAVIIVGLVIADILHQKQCHGSASHKDEVHEFMGERLTLLNTGQETNGEVLEIDVSFKLEER